MNQPAPKGSPATLKQQPGSRTPPGVPGECRVAVRYYKRMRLQRVHVLMVEGPRDLAVRTASGALPPPLTVRPMVPGAHVAPEQGQIDLAQAGSRATFYVTPLACGSLKDARVDLLHQGLLVHHIPVPMKGVTQRLTFFLALLTMLLPAFMLYFLRYKPLSGTVIVSSSAAAPNPDAPPPNAPAERAQDETAWTRQLSPGEVLERELKGNVPDLPVVGSVAAGLGKAYDFSRTLNDSFPLPFVAAVLLLGLTLWSWVAHQSARGYQRGKPLLLKGDGGRADALPATRRIESPMVERTE